MASDQESPASGTRTSEPAEPSARPSRVFLHVGSPKTGTTFLQAVLWTQRDRAREQGLLLPLDSFDDHYLGTLDVRGLVDEDRSTARAAGAWARIVEAGLAWPGRVLVSHELFAGATREQAVEAVRAWGDVDVHVVVTVRDLARQIPAEWQEHVKHRSTIAYSDFLEALRTQGPAAEWFWTVQDYARVCSRWGAAVPSGNLHVVTVPPRSAHPGLLWERFSGLVGLDPESFDLGVSRANTSLGAEQAELVRRVNEALGDRLVGPGAYALTAKSLLAQNLLAGRSGSPIVLSAADTDFAVRRSKEIVAELEAMDVHVVGDLAELIPESHPPSTQSAPGEHPDAVSDEVLLHESVEAIAALLDRHWSLRQRMRREYAELQKELDDTLDLRRSRPFVSFAIGESERHPRLMRLRLRYAHTRDRLKRLALRSGGREPSG